MEQGRLVIAALGREEYGIPIEHVREIIRLGDIRSVPDSPVYIQGLIDVRGQAIPLIDLHIRFDTKARIEAEVSEDASMDQSSYGLIIDFKGNLVALSVDKVTEVREVDRVEECPPMIQVPYISGIVNLPQRIIMKLDLALMLQDSGMEELLMQDLREN